MPVFNVSFLNPALKPSGTGGDGISVSMNQLTVLENQLKKDGYLAPGDYDLLLEQARTLEMTHALSPTDRSRIQVKISDYEQSKNNVQYDRSDNLDILNNEMKSEGFEDIIAAGNSPQQFLGGRVASLQGKLRALSETIDRRTESGQDYSDFVIEYQETMSELQSRMEALDSLEGFDGSNPIDGYAAYVTTNSRGEIIDVDYSRYGSKSGYMETNGLIDGIQVYAKPNTKENGNNVFILGDERFIAPDGIIPNPNNPGSFSAPRLISEKMFRKTEGGQETGFAQSGFTNIDGASLGTQSYIPRNAYAKGIDGTIYQRLDSGGYKKYINATPEDLNIDTSRILSIPRAYESNISNSVIETIDGAEAIRPDEDIGLGNSQGGIPGRVPGFLNGPILGTPQEEPSRPGPTREAAAALPQNQGEGQSTQVRNRASAPTERAPSPGNFMLNAARTAQSAFTSIFKR